MRSKEIFLSAGRFWSPISHCRIYETSKSDLPRPGWQTWRPLRKPSLPPSEQSVTMKRITWLRFFGFSERAHAKSEVLGAWSLCVALLLSLGSVFSSLAEPVPVRVNRTVPAVAPPLSGFRFSAQPTLEEFFRAHIFQ